ncbi:MAG: hypothetical protein AB7H03_12665 [Nitrospirales bacterium]
MALPPDLSLLDSLKSDSRKAFYESHKGVAMVMILILFLAPLVGVAYRGFQGAAMGLVLSVLAYYLAPWVVLNLEA